MALMYALPARAFWRPVRRTVRAHLLQRRQRS
jgi:hypothetical protein